MTKSEVIHPNIRRIVAPNPSPLTFEGTNTYIVGQKNVAVIDPGPAINTHLDAILAALGPEEVVEKIFVTHAHIDHSGLAPALAKATGAPVYAAGRATDGRSTTMEKLAASGLAGGGEGLDLDFTPDIYLTDGNIITGHDWQLEAISTPGHLGTHMAFAYDDVIFTGDHVMGWSTTIVSPPDGDMGAYMASLKRLSAHPAQMFLPGHGPEITHPSQRLKDLTEHRKSREKAILSKLDHTPRTAASVTAEVYTDIAPHLLPAAERNVLAHLIDLNEQGLVTACGPLGAETQFCIKER